MALPSSFQRRSHSNVLGSRAGTWVGRESGRSSKQKLKRCRRQKPAGFKCWHSESWKPHNWTRSSMPWTLVSPSVTLSFPFPLQCDGNSLDNSDNYCTEWLFIVYNKLISDVIVIITINDVRGTKLGGTSHSGKACVHVCAQITPVSILQIQSCPVVICLSSHQILNMWF